MGEKKVIEGLVERFSDLLDIVVLALCAVMSGAEDWDDMEDWRREREKWPQRYLPLHNGIPGHDTIRRVFESLPPMELELRFEAWKDEVCPAVKGLIIAIDGKALRDRRAPRAACGRCISSATRYRRQRTRLARSSRFEGALAQLVDRCSSFLCFLGGITVVRPVKSRASFITFGKSDLVSIW